jgi:hypothetical protein
MAELQNEAATIVLLGSFNPRIFQPFWFAAQDLIRSDEAEKADIKLIHSDIAMFSIGWAQLQVSSDRFAISTIKDHILIRDLVVGTFRVLEHTPVRALGMNRELHYALASQAQWHSLGDQLAPKEIWRQVLTPNYRPGMKALVIEGQRPGSSAVTFNVKVEPSRQVQNGVYFQTNEHHQASQVDSSEELSKLVDVLETEWLKVQQYSQTLAEHVLRAAKSE